MLITVCRTPTCPLVDLEIEISPLTLLPGESVMCGTCNETNELVADDPDVPAPSDTAPTQASAAVTDPLT